MILEEIENTIPYQQIYIDKSQNTVDESSDDSRKSEIEAKAIILIDLAMKAGNNSRHDIIEQLFHSEPFVSYPDLKNKLEEEILT